MDWKQYEQEIWDYFHRAYPYAKMTKDARIIGRLSKTERQIDLLVEEHIVDIRIKIIIDAKHYCEKLDVKDVEAYLGLLEDVGAHIGVLISPEGFTKAAINRAYNNDTDLILEVLNFKELKDYQGVYTIPYAGGNAALIPAPLGWIVDSTQGNVWLASIYQRGLTLEEAMRANEWMYINFWRKDNVASDLDGLLKFQEKYMRRRHPDASISYDDHPPEKKGSETRVRIYEAKELPFIEYTGFVEFDKFILFCVLFTPRQLKKTNLQKLRYVMQRIQPLPVLQVQLLQDGKPPILASFIGHGERIYINYHYQSREIDKSK